MMSEEASLFREIVGNNDDIGSRMVFADLLEERGDPRGEFIRIQCALAQHPDPKSSSYAELEKLDSEILEKNFSSWASPLLKRGLPPERIHFRLGDVDGITITPAQFRVLQDDLQDLAPLLRQINFEGVDHYINKLENWPPLQQLVHVQFRFNGTSLGAARNAVVFASEMPKLRAITLNECGWGPELLRIVARSDGFPSLQAIDLEDSGITDQVLNELFSNQRLCDRLVWLNLAMGRITLNSVRRAADLPKLENLKNLRLRGNPLGDRQVQLLRDRFGRACDLVRLYDRFGGR